VRSVEVIEGRPVVVAVRAFQTRRAVAVVDAPAVLDPETGAALGERHDAAAVTSRLCTAARAVRVAVLLVGRQH